MTIEEHHKLGTDLLAMGREIIVLHEQVEAIIKQGGKQ